MAGQMKMSRSVSLRVALVYLAIGGVWIAFSDRLVAEIATDPGTITTLQTYKGWFYVAVTAVGLFMLVDYYTAGMERAARAVIDKDLAIRKAYTDVFSAVTGGKLLIMTKDELERSLGEPLSDVRTVDSLMKLSDVRVHLREALCGRFPELDPFPIAVSTTEAVVNAVKHAGAGSYRLLTVPTAVQILVSDTGPGIDFSVLPKATLLPGFSTTQTLGLGFSFMLELCDRVLLATEPGSTNVVLEFSLPGQERMSA